MIESAVEQGSGRADGVLMQGYELDDGGAVMLGTRGFIGTAGRECWRYHTNTVVIVR